MQPLAPGWYWDPRGQPGMFRWWNGHDWTDHLSVRRDIGPPEAVERAEPVDGRYVAGGLSFPMLDGWEPCPGYPHMRGVQGQQLVVGKTPRGPYVGVVFVGGLPDQAGDLAEHGMAFADEVLHTYYPHERPHAGLEPHTEPVLGRPGWVLVVPLDVDDPALDFTQEDAVFAVVDTDEGRAVLFASLPRTGELVPTPDEVLGLLALA